MKLAQNAHRSDPPEHTGTLNSYRRLAAPLGDINNVDKRPYPNCPASSPSEPLYGLVRDRTTLPPTIYGKYPATQSTLLTFSQTTCHEKRKIDTLGRALPKVHQLLLERRLPNVHPAIARLHRSNTVDVQNPLTRSPVGSHRAEMMPALAQNPPNTQRLGTADQIQSERTTVRPLTQASESDFAGPQTARITIRTKVSNSDRTQATRDVR
jgi:hypothetical protein